MQEDKTEVNAQAEKKKHSRFAYLWKDFPHYQIKT